MRRVDDDALTALIAQDRELDGLVAGLDDDGLRTPSLCAGWSVSDVLLHLAQSNELAVASVSGHWGVEGVVAGDASRRYQAGGDVEDIAAVMVEADRSTPSGDRARWQASVAALEAAMAEVEPAARVMWVAGELAARTLATTRLAEAWIHTTDVAGGLGVAVAPTARLWHIARLAWRTVPYALAQGGVDQTGPVRFALTAPDAGAWTFGDDDAPTVVSGPAVDLCLVAGQRAAAADTGLTADGPDAEAVLRLVRTFA
jgi:uncharacterized protein (TIGR03084 family)